MSRSHSPQPAPDSFLVPGRSGRRGLLHLLTRSGRRRLCRDACRRLAWKRHHHRTVVPVVVAPPGLPRRPVTIYESAACGTRALGELRCTECGVFMNLVGLGGNCPNCEGPVADLGRPRCCAGCWSRRSPAGTVLAGHAPGQRSVALRDDLRRPERRTVLHPPTPPSPRCAPWNGPDDGGPRGLRVCRRRERSGSKPSTRPPSEPAATSPDSPFEALGVPVRRPCGDDLATKAIARRADDCPAGKRR